MKKYVVCFALCFAAIQLVAQNKLKDLFAFTITDYIVAASDTITIVQVQLPDGSNVTIPERTMGICRRNFTNNKEDTAALGWGRCQLIKGDYNYFGMHLYDKNIKPQKNDLLYTYVEYPAAFRGRIFKLIKNAIYFDRVTEEHFYNFNTAETLTELNEIILIDSLSADIKYTGKEMLSQNNGQDQDITGGIFNGKKLFAAMQTVTPEQVASFLDYVIARPHKYAGNYWKISETFATWMISNTPTVVNKE